MRQVNGSGAKFSALCVLLLCITVECLPLAAMFTLLAAAGVWYDLAHGNTTDNIKSAPRSVGTTTERMDKMAATSITQKKGKCK